MTLTNPSTSPLPAATDDTRTDDPVAGSVAAYSDHIDAYTTYNADAVADTAARFIDLAGPASRVLDAGCGPGRDLARFTAAGLRPVGIDLNPDFAAVAAAYAPVHVGDLRNLPYADDTFDGTWACASLVHLPHTDAATALRELARVTRVDGIVYSSVKHAGTTGWTETAHGVRWFAIWTPQEYADAVEKAGLRILDVVVGDIFVDVWASA